MAKRYVWYAEYQGFIHLYLLLAGWREEHCLFVDDTIQIKLVSP